MKKILTYSGIISLIILGLPFVLLMLSDYTGIGKKEGGFKAYDTFSPSKEGQDLIAKHKIKCVAKDVETLAFVDISRGETFFAYNIDHNNYYFYENIKYDKVPEEIVKQYEFSAHFTWLETYGKYIVYSMFGICIIGGVIAWWIGRR